MKKTASGSQHPARLWTMLMSKEIARAAARFVPRADHFAFVETGSDPGRDRARDHERYYQEWVAAFDTLDPADLAAIARHGESLPVKPFISVVMPVFNTPERFLRRAIESVLEQTYQNWQLCIADDASSAAHVRPILEEYTARDERIDCTFLDKNSHISDASNSALALAKGEYVGFLDHDDELRTHALYMVANEINEHPEAALIFSDEDIIDACGRRKRPLFKPGWNPDEFLSANYLCHFCVYKHELIVAVGGLRRGFEGAQDWDLALRVIERIEPCQIRHIPHILYHWRAIEGSTALSIEHKPYARRAQATAITEALTRTGRAADVTIVENPPILKVSFRLPNPAPRISLIIPAGNDLGRSTRYISSLVNHTDYPDLEIVVVHSFSKPIKNYIKFNNKHHIISINYKNNNISSVLNIGARAATGSILGFLHDDLEVITPGWLGEMAAHALRPEIGAVGARLSDPNDLIQHCGIILGIDGVAHHIHRGFPRQLTQIQRVCTQQNYSAVSAACLLTRRQVFEQVGGFDEHLSTAYHDIDLCLRVKQSGFLITWTPYAEFYHWEETDSGDNYLTNPEAENDYLFMIAKWGDVLRTDPYYNPNLTVSAGDLVFSFPPRAIRPWESRSSSAT